MNFCHKMALENKLSRHFIANVHFLLYLRTSALTLTHPHKYHHNQSQFPRSYVRKMLDILQLARIFLKIQLCLLNMPLTLHSYKQASVVNVNAIFNRLHLFILQKSARFACVCAFFVVPLQRNYYIS